MNITQLADGTIISRRGTPGEPGPFVRADPLVMLVNSGEGVHFLGEDSPEVREREARRLDPQHRRRSRIHELRALLGAPMPFAGFSPMSDDPRVQAAAGRYEAAVYTRRALQRELDALLADEQLERAASRPRRAYREQLPPTLERHPEAVRLSRAREVTARPELLPRASVRSSAPTERVRRSFTSDLRSVREDGKTKLIGHCAVFDSLSEDLGGWRERLTPGCFDRVLRSQTEAVYALWNHNPDFIIASTSDRTLRLHTDSRGLVCEIDPLDTQTIRDLVVKPIEDGKVTSMSFAFDVGTAHWELEDGTDVRVVDEIARLWDASPVCYPAYPATDISARDAWKARVVGAAA